MKSGADLAKPVHSALQQIGKRSHPDSPLTRLLFYEQVCARPSRSGQQRSPSVRLFLRRSLREFRRDRPQEAALLQQRYFDEETVKEIAHAQLVSQETVNRNQHAALRLFADWLSEQEAAAWAGLQDSLLAAVPPASYGKLFGHQPARVRLARQLQARGAPWVVCLSGIGGIGKSSLVNQVARQLGGNLRYRQIIWLEASQGSPLDERGLLGGLARRLLPVTTPASRQLAGVRRALKVQPALIVLDNLGDEVRDVRWVDLLHSLANPSKFVLCSRLAPAPLARAYQLPVGELQLKPAAALMQYQASEVGLERAMPAIRRQAAAIYARTGGNPLALKLAVGLMHAWPLDAILDDLEERRGRDVAEVYDAIYQASWNALSKDGKRTLLAMPLVAEQGAGWPQLLAICGLPAARLRNALVELRNRSLLEVLDAPDQPRYAIHQLTRTFLRRELLDEQ